MISRYPPRHTRVGQAAQKIIGSSALHRMTAATGIAHGEGIQAAYVNAVFNNQRVAYETSIGQPPHYSVTFTNVPGDGGWAWIVVNCAVVGGSQGYWVHVYRPAIGTTLVVNL